MKISGLHLLLTYKCILQCDHCFVWGGPTQQGVMTVDGIRAALHQAREVPSLEQIYFEGGEPFLYYPILVRGIQMAASMGFDVGIVTNAFWATSPDDAVLWLKPLADMIGDLTLSCDFYHGDGSIEVNVRNARAAAEQLNIPVGVISISPPEPGSAASGKLPDGESAVMYRGRAARRLAPSAPGHPWKSLDRCDSEDLREPGRLHLDSFGNLHICQGLVIGNIFQTPLKQICEDYDPETHPIIGPLLAGGPACLVQAYDIPHAEAYADCCHLCYEARNALRMRFPAALGPDQMYGE